MARRPEPVSLIKHPNMKYSHYEPGYWNTYKSTGEKVKAEQMKVALAGRGSPLWEQEVQLANRP